jgi:hypothetical protein
MDNNNFIYTLWEKQPTFFATIIVGLIAAFIAVRGLKHNVRAAKMKNSLDFESVYKHNAKVVESSLEIKKILSKRFEHPIELWGLESNFQTPQAIHISTILNEWERCANGIYHKVYDDDFLYGTYGSTVIFLFTHLQPYIVARQEHNPRAFTRFCWLALNWKVRRDSRSADKNTYKLKAALKLLSEYHTSVSRN